MANEIISFTGMPMSNTCHKKDSVSIVTVTNLFLVNWVQSRGSSIPYQSEEKLFSYPSIQTYVLGAQKSRLIETVLFSTPNIFWLRNKKTNFQLSGRLINNRYLSLPLTWDFFFSAEKLYISSSKTFFSAHWIQEVSWCNISNECTQWGI